ncbi:hypothetical protein NpPPO83_00004963 [Neofusicoccum parvum]|uniref:Uncharacterized protein n=1 Tax=Neofusicoccum parvum TaxID=310453 RepID=A0ACB5SKZ1_9PEZI|nr:hypothetical protein NpPPO83_00004963 [Neofusicoccum parvum]
MPPPTHTIEIFQCGHSTTHDPLLPSSPRNSNNNKQQHRRQRTTKRKKREHANISRALSAFLLARGPTTSPGRADPTSHVAPDASGPRRRQGAGRDGHDARSFRARAAVEADLVPRPLAVRGRAGTSRGRDALTGGVGSIERGRAGAVARAVGEAAAEEGVKEEEETMAAEEGGRPVLVYLRRTCPRDGCRGLSVVRAGQRAYDDYDAEDLRDLWENLFGLAGRAKIEVVGARDAPVELEEEKRRHDDGAAVGLPSHPATARMPLTHRRRSGPLHSSVRPRRGSSRAQHGAAALEGLYGQPQVTRETEVSSSFEVTAGQHHLLGPSRLIQVVLSDAKHIDAEKAASQLLAAVIWLSQAELLRAARAPKGWFEACLRRVAEELEGAEGAVRALEELQRT